MFQKAEADADKREHKVQAEEVPVRQLLTAACKAERPRPLGQDVCRRDQGLDGRGQEAEERNERGEREGEVEEVVDDDRQSDEERLGDLSQSTSVRMQICEVSQAHLDPVDPREDVDAVGAERRQHRHVHIVQRTCTGARL